MEQSTLEAISTTALVISVIVLVVLVFKMIFDHLSAHGKIMKMGGGDYNFTEYLNHVKNSIKNIAVAYSPDSNEYDDAIMRFVDSHNMTSLLYAIFYLLLLEHNGPEVRAVSEKILDICRNNLNMDNLLISRTIDMLITRRSRPIPVPDVYALDDEWIEYLRLPENARAPRV